MGCLEEQHGVRDGWGEVQMSISVGSCALRLEMLDLPS